MKRLSVIFALMALCACAVMAGKPENTLKAGYGIASTQVRTTTVLVDRDAISVAEAKRLRALGAVAKETLDDGAEKLRQCRALEAGKAPGSKSLCGSAVTNINLGSGVLRELETFLEAREQK